MVSHDNLFIRDCEHISQRLPEKTGIALWEILEDKIVDKKVAVYGTYLKLR